MSLNTWQRKGVFDDAELVELVASRLADPDEVRGAKAFPYQLLVAWKMTSGVPRPIQSALQGAMELSVHNVPELDGDVVICPDVSSSMKWGATTGRRRGSTSMVRCIDVAGLIAAALLRRNRSARVMPFETGLVDIRLNPRDSIATLAKCLASIGGGGTNCSAPLVQLNAERANVDAVIYVSDNESWVDSRGRSGYQSGTEMMQQWIMLRRRNPQAKLVCIDLTPNIHKQAVDRPDILNVGGFSDAVFDVVAQFLKNGADARSWADLIEPIEL